VSDAASTRSIDGAIFDFGGVLVHNGRHSDLVSRFPPEHAEAALKIFVGDYGADTDHPWHRLERGEISFAEAQRLNKEALAAAGIALPQLAPPEPEPAKGGHASPADSGESLKRSVPAMTFRPNHEMMDLVGRLREGGIRLGILTNNIREFRDLWRTLMPYEELFDDIVDSHEIGLRKPNPEIYQLALTRLGLTAERAVFLDDVPTNVSAAEAVGMYGVLVEEDATNAIAAVERLAALDERA
jgi:HAD superfamily hydrolase (TIGR01509 family)